MVSRSVTSYFRCRSRLCQETNHHRSKSYLPNTNPAEIYLKHPELTKDDRRDPPCKLKILFRSELHFVTEHSQSKVVVLRVQ